MVSYRVLCLFIWSVIVLGACVPLSASEVIVNPTELPCNQEVSWEEAIEILNSGEVTSVMQTHSLKVSFMLENGCRITTIEPRIDDIVEALQKCGAHCAKIIFATE